MLGENVTEEEIMSAATRFVIIRLCWAIAFILLAVGLAGAAPPAISAIVAATIFGF